jgi:pimeloyl-ACP methyl ester carboxylesterase
VAPVGVQGHVPHAARLATVDAAFRSLPDRYLGADPGFDSTYHISPCDLGHTWEVRCTSHGARMRKGATRRRPDVRISTDADTWMRLREGEFSGIDAFQQRRLSVRGNLDYAIGFEGLFRLPNGRPPLLTIRDVHVGRHRISTLTMGEGPDVVLLHGLGSTRASRFEIAATLGRHYRVHAPDLPGFGSSSKPPRGGSDARWFAEIMISLLDGLDIPDAHFVGNSMGGRIAIEVGLSAPERVRALGLMCPAVAWIKRGLHPIVRLLRPELGLLPHGFRRSTVASQLWGVFHDEDAIDPAVVDPMVDEFRRIYHSAGARFAFLASAHHLPRVAIRARRLLPAPVDAPAARSVHLRKPRFVCSGGVRPPRAPLAASGRAGDDRRVRPRAAVERADETGEMLLRFFARCERVEPLHLSARGLVRQRGAQAA